jgi:two-component system nitrate/nitrite response regulator NarL
MNGPGTGGADRELHQVARKPRHVERERVLIADDHALFRLSLREEIEAAGLEVCAEAGSADEAIAFARELRPELCLLDGNMYGSGIEASRTILASVPETRIVLVTASSEFDDFLAAVHSGVRGYLIKCADPAQLAHTLRDVLAGSTAYPRAFAARLRELPEPPGPAY